MKKIFIGLIIGCSMIIASESFSHEDWEVVCDNTHTCRMAGYTEYTLDQSYFPISLYFERKAGAKTVIESKIDFADYPENVDENRVKTHTFKMFIGKNSFIIDRSKKIPQRTTDAMIGALVKDKKIYFTYGDAYKWEFSQKGSFAAMLKMDEYQKRIGTVGAMFKKGHKNEDKVLQPAPVPVIYIPRSYSTAESLPKVTLSGRDKKLLEYLISNYYSEGENGVCWMDFEEAKTSMEIYRLDDKTALVSQQCWMAAYNFANGYWLINRKPPFDPRFVTSASDLGISGGGITISHAHKGRGIGDCWSMEAFVWNGEKFVESSSSSTGQCRGFAGGAWDFPTLITQIKVKE